MTTHPPAPRAMPGEHVIQKARLVGAGERHAQELASGSEAGKEEIGEIAVAGGWSI